MNKYYTVKIYYKTHQIPHLILILRELVPEHIAGNCVATISLFLYKKLNIFNFEGKMLLEYRPTLRRTQLFKYEKNANCMGAHRNFCSGEASPKNAPSPHKDKN